MEKIYEFKKNNSSLIGYDEVIKITKSFFSVSPFWINRKELLKIITPDNFLFAFKFGIIVTKNGIIFLGNKNIKNVEFDNIEKIKVDLSNLKITYEDSEIGLLTISKEQPNLFISFQNMFISKKPDSSINYKYYCNIYPKSDWLKKLIQLIQEGNDFSNIYKSLLLIQKSTDKTIKESEKYLDEIKNNFKQIIESWKIEEKVEEEERVKKDLIEKEKQRIVEEMRITKLNNFKDSILSQLDKDGNGQIDLTDGESFNSLLTKNQKIIIEIDKMYIQKFVKISIYLKTKKHNTQTIFESIKDTKNQDELYELVGLLRNQIHSYNSLVFHSISMITSLVNNDLITFYEIYECFDQLGVFNSNWENEVSNKLTNIGDGIKDLMYSIHEMESRIVDSIDNLSYITQDSFSDLSRSIESELSSINSSIGVNNLLTGIQTYQMYKINQNTKRIN